MKIFLYIIILFSCYSANCQIDREVVNSLRDLNFKRIDSVSKILTEQKSEFRVQQKYFSDIIADYEAGWLHIVKGEFEVSIWIRVIRYFDRIVYYSYDYDFELYEGEFGDLRDQLKIIKKTNIDQLLYRKLESSFKDLYNSNLNIKDLFKMKIFGGVCGIGEELLPEMKIILSLVEKKDTTSLYKWLQSSNITMQLFGVYGYEKLSQKGYKLTNQESKLITIIKNKKGSVETCSGCLGDILSIKEVIHNLNDY